MAGEEPLWLYAYGQVTLVELAQASGLDEQLLRELVDYGALAPADPDAADWRFGAECVARVCRAARLRADLDLELDTPALALVISFLERIQGLEAEVRRLSAQLSTPRR